MTNRAILGVLVLCACFVGGGCLDVAEGDTGSELSGACDPPNYQCNDRYHAQYCQNYVWQPALDCRVVCAQAPAYNPSGCCAPMPGGLSGCQCCGLSNCSDRPECYP
jgi:hypothetical protein